MNVAQLRAALEGVPDHLDVVVPFDDEEQLVFEENLIVDTSIAGSRRGPRYFALHCEPWVGVSMPQIEGAGDHAADKPPK